MFSWEVDDFQRLTNIVWALPIQRHYAAVYSDFVLLDGTHWADRFGDVLMPPLVVDGLGRTQPCGWILAPSENAQSAINGLGHLGFKSADCHPETLMTDDAPLWVNVAETFNSTHLLCSDHYRTTINAASAGLPSSSTFKKDAMSLIYGNYHTEDGFETAYNKMRRDFSTPAATAWLLKLHGNRHKVVFTFTKNTFTAGYTATQRSESYNSALKGGAFSHWKATLKGSNYYQVFIHVKNHFQDVQAKVRFQFLLPSYICSILRVPCLYLPYLPCSLAHSCPPSYTNWSTQ